MNCRRVFLAKTWCLRAWRISKLAIAQSRRAWSPSLDRGSRALVCSTLTLLVGRPNRNSNSIGCSDKRAATPTQPTTRCSGNWSVSSKPLTAALVPPLTNDREDRRWKALGTTVTGIKPRNTPNTRKRNGKAFSAFFRVFRVLVVKTKGVAKRLCSAVRAFPLRLDRGEGQGEVSKSAVRSSDF